MNFWNNILRYPRFFLSSMLGLILLLVSPVRKLAKELKNKNLFIFLFLLSTFSILSILFLMINPSD